MLPIKYLRETKWFHVDIDTGTDSRDNIVCR